MYHTVKTMFISGVLDPKLIQNGKCQQQQHNCEGLSNHCRQTQSFLQLHNKLMSRRTW